MLPVPNNGIIGSMKTLVLTLSLFITSIAFADVKAPSIVNNSLVEISGVGKQETKWIMFVISKKSFEEQYTVPAYAGKFKAKVALQDGAGNYKIKIYQNTTADRYASYKALELIKVENTDERNMSFLLPTDVVQSDDPRITALVKNVTKDAKSKAEGFQNIYNYIAGTVKYDHVRYKNKTYMNHVYDALSVLENPVAVCSGYANLLAAMSRAYGIRAKIINGKALMSYGWGAHAWNEVYVNNEWKMVDSTWDAGRKYQSYYFMAPDRFENDHQKEMEMRY